MLEEIDKNGAISDVLSPNQSILIQIVKEPISTKGPRLTTEISLAGRFMVLIPFSNYLIFNVIIDKIASIIPTIQNLVTILLSCCPFF